MAIENKYYVCCGLKTPLYIYLMSGKISETNMSREGSLIYKCSLIAWILFGIQKFFNDFLVTHSNFPALILRASTCEVE